MPARRSSDPANPREEFLSSYAEYSKTLRTWLVAFGIGGPVLFLTHEHAWQALANSGMAYYVGNLFVGGVVAQIIIAFLNKVLMWSLYHGEVVPAFKRTRRYKLADKLSDAFWLDIFFDIASMILFTLALLKVFSILITYRPNTPNTP